MSTNDTPHYDVAYAEPKHPDQWLNYDDNPDHHRLRTCDEAIALAQEYMRQGRMLIQISDEYLMRQPVILVNKTGVINQYLDASDPDYEERKHMYDALWRAWKEMSNYKFLEIIHDTGGALRTLKNREHLDIKIVRVDVPVGGDFTLSLADLKDYQSEELICISRPNSGYSIEINKIIDHDLAYSLRCFDDRQFRAIVVCEEVTPRMPPSAPLGL